MLFLIAGVIIIVFLGLVGLFIFKPHIKSYLNRKTFNSAEWASDAANNSGVRLQMIDSLQESHHLLGKAKSEIDALLGVPPKTGYFKNYDYVYWLGSERSIFSIDSEWLVIKFQNDLVIETKVVSD